MWNSSAANAANWPSWRRIFFKSATRLVEISRALVNPMNEDASKSVSFGDLPAHMMLWRMFEWMLVAGWVLLFLGVSGFFDSGRSYYWGDRPWWREQGTDWLPITLFVPMFWPLTVGQVIKSQKRLRLNEGFAIGALLLFGAAFAWFNRPKSDLSDPPTLLGVFVPFGFYCLAVFLWLSWRKK